MTQLQVKTLFNRSKERQLSFSPEQFTDERKMIQDLSNQFVEKEVMPELAAIEEQDFERTIKLIQKAGELGLLGADVPEVDGGLELGKVSEMIIAESIGKTRSFSITFGGQTGIGVLPIVYFGSKAQKEKYLPAILSGETIVSYALTEPTSGTDAMSLRTSAQLSEDGKFYMLNGEKQWITNASFADLFIVYARVPEKGITAFIVEKDRDGLTVGSEEKKMGLHGSSTCSVILTDVKVPATNVIGEEGRGHIIAFNILNIGRLKIGASSLGLAKRSIELVVQYGKERKQFNKSLTDFSLIKEKIAQMAIKTFMMESTIYRTAGLMEESFSTMDPKTDSYANVIAPFAVECSINKVLSTEYLDNIIDEAVQIHGGYGFMAEYEVEKIYRDARVNRIFEGTNEINRLLITDSIFKQETYSIETVETEVSELQGEKEILQILIDLFKEVTKRVREKEYIDLNEEQELSAFIADLTITIYSIQAAIERTEFIIINYGVKIAEIAIKCTNVFTHDAASKQVQNYLQFSDVWTNDVLDMMNELANKRRNINSIGAKREIAEKLIDEEFYKIT